jgi:hypothetical protein
MIKILKRIAYIVLAIPVTIVWLGSILVSPLYWIFTGDPELFNRYAEQSIKLSIYLRN